MIKKIVALFSISCLITANVYVSANDSETTSYIPYEWNPVTVGGGGVVADYIFHPKEQGYAIARGDVGGAWIKTAGKERWESIANFSYDEYIYHGCDGIAIDPNNPDVLYWCGGRYSWTDSPGAVLKSTDRGKTWKNTGFNDKAFNSDSGQKSGNTIMVDPANSNIVYFGTYNGKGLWRSKDAAATWEKVESLPVNSASNYMRVFAFDPSSVNGGITKRIYVYVHGQGMYVTEDGSDTWNLMEGYPGSSVKYMSIAKDGTLVCADSKGLFKYENGIWSEISDISGATYTGVAIDPNNKDFIVAVRKDESKIMCLPVLVTEDGGETWFNASNNPYKIKHTGYLEDNCFSSNTFFVKMDPFNPKHVVIGDWFGLYETFDITAKPVVTWEDDNLGIEELCVLNIQSHENNPYRLLVSAMDQDGFPIADIDSLQPRKFTDMYATFGGSKMMTTSGLDICYDNANFVVRTGVSENADDNARASYSEDGGNLWKHFKTNPLTGLLSRAGSSIRFSSNINDETGKPAHIVVTRSGMKAVVSHDFGVTWSEIDELPVLSYGYNSSKQNLEKDASLDNTFYFYDWNNGHFYRSTDGGENWNKVHELAFKPSTEGFPRMVSIPGSPGEVWFVTGASAPHNQTGQLYKTTDGFETLSPVSEFSYALSVGFGKAATGQDNVTLYVLGMKDGTLGVYRSIDMGESWNLITDRLPAGFWNDPKFVCGDMHDFGVVYVAGTGSGIFVGKPEGTKISPIPGNTDEDSEDTTVYDYNWSGSLHDWTYDENKFIAINDTLKAINGSGITTAFASYDTVKWNDSITIKCYVDSLTYNEESFSICFNRKDNNDHYKLEITGRNHASLRKMVHGNTQEVLASYTAPSNAYFQKGYYELSYDKGKINVWFTRADNARTQIFKDITDNSWLSKYSSGTVAFAVKTYSPTEIRDISIRGDFTASGSILSGTVTGTQKFADGSMAEVEFNGLKLEAEEGSVLSGDMLLNIPVRYIASSETSSASLFVAYYGGQNELLDVHMQKVPLSSENKDWVEVPVNAKLPSGTTKIRCFVWNSQTLCPSLNMSHAN